MTINNLFSTMSDYSCDWYERATTCVDEMCGGGGYELGMPNSFTYSHTHARQVGKGWSARNYVWGVEWMNEWKGGWMDGWFNDVNVGEMLSAKWMSSFWAAVLAKSSKKMCGEWWMLMDFPPKSTQPYHTYPSRGIINSVESEIKPETLLQLIFKWIIQFSF